VNSILYQRGVYAPETFERKDEYGITLFVTKDKEILTYFDNILPNLEGNIYSAATVGWDVAGSV
jgi:mitotic spindle assembly checkpoint protein MAD2